ncbi:MAG: hypothetical protein H7210_00600, partial [Pyrinomonadaceae bacterium]|nr:hypothetical protein [Phycisphaerales bacterium]
NLTEELGGPTLAPDSLTSNYHIGLRTMNIVGQDSNGQARSYWWTPDGGWNIHALSGGLDPDLIPLGPWQISGTSWLTVVTPPYDYTHSQSLLGHNADGDLVRLLWRSHGPDEWVLQNLTMTSVPYFP